MWLSLSFEFPFSGSGLASNLDEDYQHVVVGVNKTSTVDSDKASKMSSGQCIKKQIAPIKVEHLQPEFVGLSSKSQKKASKDHPRARDIPVHGWKNLAVSRHERLTQPSRGHGVGNKKSVTGSKHDQLNEVNLLLAQKSEAAEAFVNQKLFVGKYLGKDGANYRSKQFLDALEVLNSNKELFLKLLEDPNSLLVKHIQDLRDSQAGKEPAKSLPEDRRSECGLSNAKQQEGAEHTQKSQKKNGHSLFWKKIKWDRYSSKGSSNHQPSHTIEVSKPCLTRAQNFESRTRLFPSQQHQYGLRDGSQNGRSKSEHAMVENRKEQQNRKEQHCNPMDDALRQPPYYDLRGSEFVGKWIGGKIVGRSSPSSAKLDIGNTAKSSTDIKRRKKIGKPKDFGLSIQHETGSTSGSGSKSLKISAAKYSKQKESSIYAEAKRHLSEMLSNEDKDEFFSTKQVLGPLGTILSLPGYDLSSKLSPRWETEHGFVTAEMRFSPYSNFQAGLQNRQSLQKEKNKTSHPSPLGQNQEDPPCANIKKPIDQLQVPDSKTGFPHLLSDAKLHESICSIRDYSSWEDDLPMQLEITFDKHCSASRMCPLDPAVDSNTCMEDHQFADKYVREVTQAYGLNCDELLADRQSPMECWNDPKLLLFDCINEVVLEVYDRYFRHLPWVSSIKPKIQPVPLTERDVVREIMEGVDARLLLQLSPEVQHQRDVKKSGAWLDDIRTDVEDIVIDIVETSLEALIEETILEQQA
ncbi:hypothetical protein PVL29_001800 [Vitis rotundifolia]|uniref:DUF4378 domain-containing protein n=1 Tax=Vitis rotundifolia TaxID=103349 RepID=A0AA39E6H0_VITRO|nr:hypothetical protein PVL29_001800 [Vitis rotundifolia]